MNVARLLRRQVEVDDSDFPTGGSDTAQGRSGFLGGFPADHPVRVPTPVTRTGMSADAADRWAGVEVTTDSTLQELADAQIGGYMEKDVWAPANEPPETVAQLQIMLVNAGLLDPEDFAPGHYDGKTRSAYRELLTFANASGATWDETLSRLSQSPFPANTAKSKANLVQVSNPDDLRTIFRTAARQTLGYGNIDDADLDRMVAAYQGLERQAQTAPDAAAGDVTVTAAPDPTVFADQQLRTIDPSAYDSRKVVAAADVMARLFRGEE